MADTSSFSCRQWPYFIFRCEDFRTFKTDSKVSRVDNMAFKVTLEYLLSENSDNISFRMYFESAPHQNRDMAPKTIMMVAEAYVLRKSKQRLPYRSTNVELPPLNPKTKIFDVKEKALLEGYDSCRQSDGGVYFVCLVKPRQEQKKYYPQIMLPKEVSGLNKEMEARICWNSFDALSSDFGSLLEESKGNFLLKCGSFQAYVHRIIISKRCAKFGEKLLKLTLLDPPANEMNVTELDVNTLDILLKYVYCGRIPAISASDAQKLFVFGLKYAMTDFMDLCAEMIIDNVTHENVLDLLLFADKHEHDKLKSCMTDYILSNNILKSKRWLEVCANMKIALEVYRANVAKSYS